MAINKKWVVLIIFAAVFALAAQPVAAAEKSLKVGVYGGYFKDSFDKHIFPDFTKETGIKVESVRRADRRGLAGPARAGRQGGRSPRRTSP